MIGFDPTLHIGDILVAFTIAIGGAGFLWKTSGRLSAIEEALGSQNSVLSELKTEVKELRVVLVNQAEMRQQIISLEKRVSELAHGEGYVLPLRKSPYEADG